MSRGAAALRAAMSALSLVVVGAVAGIAVDRHLHRGSAAGSHDPATLHEAAMESMHGELDLSEAQRRAVDSVMQEHQAALKRSWAELHQILGAAADTVHRDIEALLTPEQRVQFKEWLHRSRSIPP